MRLINTDSFEIVEEIIESTENAVIVTDPPFNIGYHYDKYDDNMPEEEYWEKMAWIFSLAPSVVVHYPETLHRLSVEMGKAPERVFSWVYNSNTAKQHRDIGYYGIKPDFRRVKQPYKNMNDKRVKKLYEKTGGGRQYDWYECNQVKNVSREKTAHPCQMPVSVMEKAVGILPDGITVIDPFMGSGTTGVACVNLGVDFIGIEMDPNYFKIAEQRVRGGLNDA